MTFNDEFNTNKNLYAILWKQQVIINKFNGGKGYV